MTNILLLSVDDLNNWTSALGGYGGVIHTPNIDRIAAEATTFANAYATAPGCNQSRTATLSGMSPLTTGVLTNNQYAFDYVDPDQTLPAILQAAGYETATAGKVFHDLLPEVSAQIYDTDISPADPENALDKEEALVDRTVENWEAGIFTGDPDRLTDAITVSAVEDFLAAYAPTPGKEGLFLSVGLSRPHNPWYVPREYFDLYPLDEIVVPDLLNNDLADVPAFAQTFTDEKQVDRIIDEGEYRAFVQGYLAAVSYADAMIGRLLDALQDSAIGGDTKVVLWSDHGFHLGEKDNIGKFTLWEQAARAQFMVWDPAAPTGVVRDEAVSLLDLMPTVLDYAGVDAPDHAQGQSLRELIETGADPDLRGFAVTLIRGSYSLRTDDWRYTRYEDGSEELYDEVNDPDEYDNLAGDAAYAAIKAGLSATLDDYIEDGLVVQNYDTTPRRLEAEDGERTLIGGFGADTLVGGGADNVYVVRNEDQRVVETRSGGIDTVLARDSFVLPNNVENLSAENRDGPTEGPNERSYVGNRLSNVISINFGQATVAALGGDDTVNGGQGEDSIDGGSGDDSIKADDGDDTIAGGAGSDSLQGGKDDDLYVLSDGADTISERRDQGDDTIDISAWGFANLQITQVRGNGGGGVTALALTNWLTGEQTLVETVQGKLDVEFLTDGTETRVLTLRGANGADGGQTLFGGTADDTLTGTDGRDLLRGGEGNDALQGGEADDVLEGGAGDDLLNGNAGRDVADYTLAAGAVGVDLTAGTATGEGVDQLREIEDALGSGFSDTLLGSGFANRLVGGRGNDCVVGGAGDDTLEGGVGRDTLLGGPGADVLIGGRMGDLFVFAVTTDGADTIADWDAMDRIDLAAIDAVPTTGPDNAFSFIGGAAFDAAGQVRVLQIAGATLVELNTDADTAAELTIRLDGLRLLTASDFVL